MMPGQGAMAPSGMMFVCALLVRKGGKSKTSNVGDQGQDVITMTDEAACLPLYLIETSCDMGMAGAMMPGMAGGGGGENYVG